MEVYGTMILLGWVKRDKPEWLQTENYILFAPRCTCAAGHALLDRYDN